MAAAASDKSVEEPFPIFTLAHRYLLYDASTVSYIRREYNICGVLIGGLPQAPQQNVFQGLPLELMPEDARLLVEQGTAYTMDDVSSHKHAFLGQGLNAEERKAFEAAIVKQGLGEAKQVSSKAHEGKKAALKKKFGVENWNDIPDEMLKLTEKTMKHDIHAKANLEANVFITEGDDAALFAPSATPDSSGSGKPCGQSAASTAETELWTVTPTTSYPPLQLSPIPPKRQSNLLDAPPSYPLFKHMHDQGYFLAPGLRFGCQYMAYPGDPLRFHSHFLCNGMEWDQEFDLLDLVGGGRLGTGVKKGFLIGGLEAGGGNARDDADATNDGVRTFCIEWGGM